MSSCGIQWPQIILFGDSITQGSFDKGGWGGAIANRLVRRCDVLNRGLSGYNTKWALNVLPKIITQPTNQATIAAVAVFIGANDSALKDVNPVQHIPLTEYTENLKRIIQYLKSIGVCEEKMVMITPPPLDESAWEKACITEGGKLDRCNSVTKQYAEACVKVATEYGTDVLDLWTLMQMENRHELKSLLQENAFPHQAIANSLYKKHYHLFYGNSGTSQDIHKEA